MHNLENAHLLVERLHVHVYMYLRVQWNPSIMDTTGTKNFVLYSEVSFAQGVIVDHAPLTIVANYAGARLWIMK